MVIPTYIYTLSENVDSLYLKNLEFLVTLISNFALVTEIQLELSN